MPATMENPQMDPAQHARWVERTKNIPVNVCYTGTAPFCIRFDGNDYPFEPDSFITVTAEVAWHFLGNPWLRDNPAEWNAEIERLQRLHGVVSGEGSGWLWKCIEEGKFWVDNSSWGKGRKWYSTMKVFEPKAIVKSQPLSALNQNPLGKK